jgi:hypothetical protein
MKIKNIKTVLTKKIKSWVRSIDPNEVAVIAAIEKDTLVSGGAITSMLMNEKVNDYDIYFKTVESARVVAEYYLNEYKKLKPESPRIRDAYIKVEDGRVLVHIPSVGITDVPEDKTEPESDNPDDNVNQYDPENVEEIEQVINKDNEPVVETPLYKPKFISSNAITLTDDIQVVIRFTGDITEIHKNYDFTHCKCAFDYSNKNMFIHDDALECMLNKELRYTTSRYPLCSIMRIRKFIDRGWHINAGQILKMAWDLNKLDLKNVHVLRDQLIGVDSAYFGHLLYLIEKKQSETNNKQVDSEIDETYLMEVINLIF